MSNSSRRTETDREFDPELTHQGGNLPGEEKNGVRIRKEDIRDGMMRSKRFEMQEVREIDWKEIEVSTVCMLYSGIE